APRRPHGGAGDPQRRPRRARPAHRQAAGRAGGVGGVSSWPAVLLRLGLRSLLVHKLRSVLSILGVVFGVAAVTAVSAVGEGARREAVAQIGSLGIDTVTVRARPASGGAPAGLRLADPDPGRSGVPHLVAAAPLP